MAIFYSAIAKRGFSLVELSIVLVILGLLTGGILAGKSLIRAAEIRSVTTDVSRYLSAVSAFKDKYFAIPGDMTNATSFWGSLGGTGSDATCQAIAATGTATCNGDGDASVARNFGTVASYEDFRFWQHLANAGLIEGSYTGTVGSGSTPGTNVPPSRTSAGNYWAAAGGPAYTGLTTTYYAGGTNAFAADYGLNWLQLRSTTANVAVTGSHPLAPQEAWNIDTKMDDGFPGTGRIISNKGNGTNSFCTSTAGGAAGAGDVGATYQLSNDNRDCWIFFLRYY